MSKFIHRFFLFLTFLNLKISNQIGSTIEKRCRKFSVLKLGPCSEIAANVNLLEGNLLIFMKIIYFTFLATFICRDWPRGILKLFGVQLTFLYRVVFLPSLPGRNSIAGDPFYFQFSVIFVEPVGQRIGLWTPQVTSLVSLPT